MASEVTLTSKMVQLAFRHAVPPYVHAKSGKWSYGPRDPGMCGNSEARSPTGRGVANARLSLSTSTYRLPSNYPTSDSTHRARTLFSPTSMGSALLPLQFPSRDAPRRSLPSAGGELRQVHSRLRGHRADCAATAAPVPGLPGPGASGRTKLQGRPSLLATAPEHNQAGARVGKLELRPRRGQRS